MNTSEHKTNQLLGKIALYLPEGELKNLLIPFDAAAVIDNQDHSYTYGMDEDHTNLLSKQTEKAIHWLDHQLENWKPERRAAFCETRLNRLKEEMEEQHMVLRAELDDSYDTIISRDIIIEYLAQYVPEGDLKDLLELFKMLGHWRIEGEHHQSTDYDKAVEQSITVIRNFIEQEGHPGENPPPG